MAKLEFDFPALDTLKKHLDEIGGDALDKAVKKALTESNELISSQLEAAIQPHRKTGRVESSLRKKADIEKTGTEYSMHVGFNISEGGLPSIFLMYGTTVHGQPHIQPDRKLYNAIYGNATKQKIQQLHAKAFRDMINEVMKE